MYKYIDMVSLNDLKVYQVAMQIGDTAWMIVKQWDWFEKDTLGKQLVRAADSIALNISEGYGRYHYAENKNFCYYSRGSAYETATVVKKAISRNLLDKEAALLIKEQLNLYFRLINPYIKSIGTTSP